MCRNAHIGSKDITFSPKLPSGNKNVPFESNPLPCPAYLHLSISAILVNLTAPNKQFFNLRSRLACQA